MDGGLPTANSFRGWNFYARSAQRGLSDRSRAWKSGSKQRLHFSTPATTTAACRKNALDRRGCRYRGARAHHVEREQRVRVHGGDGGDGGDGPPVVRVQLDRIKSCRGVVGCPRCGMACDRVHSRYQPYQRRLRNLSWSGVPVALELSVRLFVATGESARRACSRSVWR